MANCIHCGTPLQCATVETRLECGTGKCAKSHAMFTRAVGVVGGQLCITGTRIRPTDVWDAFRSGRSIQEIRTYFSTRELTTEEVEGSLRHVMKHGRQAKR